MSIRICAYGPVRKEGGRGRVREPTSQYRPTHPNTKRDRKPASHINRFDPDVAGLERGGSACVRGPPLLVVAYVALRRRNGCA